MGWIFFLKPEVFIIVNTPLYDHKYSVTFKSSVVVISLLNLSFCLLVVITVTFSQSTYSYDEDAGPAQHVLVLSNPSSTDITVQVFSTDGTATGE